MDAFDADIVILAAAEDPRGAALLAQIQSADPAVAAGVGSVLLIPETLVLSRAARVPGDDEDSAEFRRLAEILARLDLHPVTRTIAELAVPLRAKYRLKTADAIHLATAIASGADRFVTNNSKDFKVSITEIEITHPSGSRAT